MQTNCAVRDELNSSIRVVDEINGTTPEESRSPLPTPQAPPRFPQLSIRKLLLPTGSLMDQTSQDVARRPARSETDVRVAVERPSSIPGVYLTFQASPAP